MNSSHFAPSCISCSASRQPGITRSAQKVGLVATVGTVELGAVDQGPAVVDRDGIGGSRLLAGTRFQHAVLQAACKHHHPVLFCIFRQERLARLQVLLLCLRPLPGLLGNHLALEFNKGLVHLLLAQQGGRAIHGIPDTAQQDIAVDFDLLPFQVALDLVAETVIVAVVLTCNIRLFAGHADTAGGDKTSNGEASVFHILRYPCIWYSGLTVINL